MDEAARDTFGPAAKFEGPLDVWLFAAAAAGPAGAETGAKAAVVCTAS